MKIISLIFITLTFLWNCTAQKTPDFRKNIQREWMLITFEKFSKKKLIDLRAKINLVPYTKIPNK